MSETSIRPALITKVLPDSIAAEIGFEPGDAIVAINGTRPRDLIDYQFLCADEVLELEVLDAAGKSHSLEIEKDYDDDLGLEFETALFDGLFSAITAALFASLTNSHLVSGKVCTSKTTTTASAFSTAATDTH
jgi:NifB/MoaA-like Fe-S oxidoreductase